MSAALILAGYVIMQTVTTENLATKAKSESSHEWTLDETEGKFVLQVSSGKAGSTRYVFNGKTLYACGELDQSQLDVLKKSLTADGLKLLKKYEGGACQVVPSNFMARFFLSPMATVESVDVTDGLRLTLGVEDYKVEPGDKKSCFKRSYTVTRSADGQATSPASVAESFCQQGIPWRKNLWMEVAKSVLRQPKGKDLMQQLKKDQGELGGFTIEAEGTQGGKGKEAVRFALKTDKVAEAKVDPGAFQTPPGYSVFSPENLELLAAANAKADKASGPAAKGEGTVLEFMQSAVFCAIAGKLGCFGN